MRTIWTVILISLFFFSSAQEFEHFINPEYEFYFEYTDEPGNYHSLAIINSEVLGDTTFYYPHKITENGNWEDTCFWIYDYCADIVVPGILGEKITTYQPKKWILKNRQEDEIHFDLNLEIGEFSVMAQWGNEVYFIIREEDSIESYFSEEVEIYNYKVFHQILGSPDPSPIDPFYLEYSQEYGFLKFFDVFNFPEDIRTTRIVGHNDWVEGPRLKNDMELVTWAVGDIIVYYQRIGPLYEPPDIRYFKHTIYDVDSSATEITYLTHVTTQLNQVYGWPGDPYVVSTYSYYDDELIFSSDYSNLEYPLDNFLTEENYGHHYDYIFSESTFNDIDRKLYRYDTNYADFCNADSICIGGGGIYSSYYSNHFEDLGRTRSRLTLYGDYGAYAEDYNELIAYKKGEEIYNDPYIVNSLEENQESKLIIYPNPTNGLLFFEKVLDRYFITDLSGKTVLNGSGNQADLSHLSPGIYLLQGFVEDQFFSQKIVKE